ncbi:MAG: hypothetical protein K2O64_05205, partial [Lactobacillus sp.]|nr:hypothetical protein [Lactobacillus sp.]
PNHINKEDVSKLLITGIDDNNILAKITKTIPALKKLNFSSRPLNPNIIAKIAMNKLIDIVIIMPLFYNFHYYTKKPPLYEVAFSKLH